MTMPALPTREGERPETGPSVPHVQLTQNSPDEIRENLKHWMSTELPGTVIRPSEISEPGALAFFLDGALPPQGAVLLPPRLNAEFAHVHPDGSLHLSLSFEDQRELLLRGWGERHPLYSAQINVVMLYGPRTADELDVARTVIEASYRYATGRDRVAA
ncbi:luciferase family protein [Nonomuraea sp. NPDC049152]|uniref:luciferase domain-containing protein n=1 Tax=Nonomuraea sp. NPDC049152 TaxID=3154350 RepID=UPI0033C3297D